MTRNAAMGQSNTEPSSLASIYIICTSPVSGDYNERAEVTRAHLAVKCFFDSCVASEDEVTEFEIEVFDSVGMIFFKTNRCLDASSINDITKVCELTLTFLQGNCLSGDEIGSRKWGIRCW